MSEVSCDYANSLLAQLERAESERDEWKAEAAQLKARLEAAERDKLSAEAQANDWKRSIQRAESEVAELRAEVERLRAECQRLRSHANHVGTRQFASEWEAASRRALEAAAMWALGKSRHDNLNGSELALWDATAELARREAAK